MPLVHLVTEVHGSDFGPWCSWTDCSDLKILFLFNCLYLVIFCQSSFEVNHLEHQTSSPLSTVIFSTVGYLTLSLFAFCYASYTQRTNQFTSGPFNKSVLLDGKNPINGHKTANWKGFMVARKEKQNVSTTIFQWWQEKTRVQRKSNAVLRRHKYFYKLE